MANGAALSLTITRLTRLIRQRRALFYGVRGLVWGLFLAIVAHVLGQGLIVAGVGRTPAALAGVILLIQPVAAGLVAWPLFGETLTLVQLAGAALVLAGVWLAGRR